MRRFRFKEGRNCWRIARADRVAVLVDGEAYFSAVRAALVAAQRRVFILAWDIHSQLELVREDPGDGLPTRLGDLILALLARRPELEVRILLWDYAPIYALEREPLFFGDSPWNKHPRLYFVQDDRHPLAASHHQKLVVVDGAIAFCGGFDLSKWRWDTNEHRAEDRRRVDTQGDAYPPFHDVQMLVDGSAAAALETICLERWQWATSETLDPAGQTGSDPWPDEVVPLLSSQDCAVARTLPRYQDQEEVREVEQLYGDMIDTAEDFIYLENQYLTSAFVCDALAARLRRRTGPEVVIVLPRETGGWLEQHTMDVLRSRLLAPLREADRHGRLRVYYPAVPGLDSGCLMVHAKLTIVDDRLLRVGSANLSNRSMGLDTECDLCIEAGDEGSRAAIAGLRRRLLGMLLGVDSGAVADAEDREAGLIAAIESLRGDARTLAPLRGDVDPEWERQLPDDRLIDPDRPLSAEDLGDAVMGSPSLVPARRRLWLGVGLVLLVLALAAAWRWTPLGEWLEPRAMADALTGALHGPWGPVLTVAGFVGGSLLAIPVTLLILVAALVYGPALGALLAMAGSMAAALATYGIGQYLGRASVERLSGGSVHRLSERLARRGILTVVAVRIIPVAPFTVINLFAGASRIRLRDYVIGTLIGMMPGVAAMAVFAEGILALLRNAGLRHFLVVALALAFIVGLTLLARRLFVRLNGGDGEEA
jgi:phospholipase D1/2